MTTVIKQASSSPANTRAVTLTTFPFLCKDDDFVKWKHFPRYWPFVRGIHRSPVISPRKGQWCGALVFSFYLRLNKWLSKQSWGWWFETLSRPLWRHCNERFKSYFTWALYSGTTLCVYVVSGTARALTSDAITRPTSTLDAIVTTRLRTSRPLTPLWPSTVGCNVRVK